MREHFNPSSAWIEADWGQGRSQEWSDWIILQSRTFTRPRHAARCTCTVPQILSKIRRDWFNPGTGHRPSPKAWQNLHSKPLELLLSLFGGLELSARWPCAWTKPTRILLTNFMAEAWQHSSKVCGPSKLFHDSDCCWLNLSVEIASPDSGTFLGCRDPLSVWSRVQRVSSQLRLYHC